MSGLKTLEEHILSIETMARLCFFYASRWLKGEFAPEKSMSECVSKHTPLLFHGLIHYDMEKWQEIPLCRLIMETADKLAPLPPDLFEEEMWALCGKEINARADFSPQAKSQILLAPFGAWTSAARLEGVFSAAKPPKKRIGFLPYLCLF